MPKTYKAVAIIFFLYINAGKVFALTEVHRVYIEHTLIDTTLHSKDSLNNTKDTAQLPKEAFALKPVIGLGTGMLSYFGNITVAHSRFQNPMTSRIGYELTYAQKLTPVTELNLYALFGKLSINERSPTLNWNFLSEIRGGGTHILFKIFPNQPITPYVLTGIESFEYLTKSDLYDKYGNKYYYWSDGSIRNVAQNAANAASATVIYRNYSFESDIREMNINGSGKYSLQTFAIPLGAGFMFHIGKRADLMIGTTLHYAFTNHIDGYGDSIKTKRNDMFLMSSVSLRIDISRSRKKHYDTAGGGYVPGDYDNVDFEALMNEDNDHDGIRDWDDSCPGTPKGAAVNAKGCPLDGDHDGVPDYLDKQLNTPPGAIVDNQGVALSDSAILLQYEIYMDSTGKFAQVEVQNRIGAPTANESKKVNYTVQVGRFSQGIPPAEMDKLLSVPGVQSAVMPDSSTIYTVGNYNDYSQAQKKQQQMIQSGIADAKVVYKKGKDYVVTNAPIEEPSNSKVNNLQNNNIPVTNNNPPPNNNVKTADLIIYRVQLGAYSHKLAKDIFANIDNLVEVKTEDGYYTYSAGSFTTYQDAVNYKTQLITEGFPNTFIKAYKNGKRIPLKDAGATYIEPTKEDMNENVTQQSNALDKTQIKFKVEIGAFNGPVPDDFAAKVKTMADVSITRDHSGVTHYLAGSYSDLDSASHAASKLALDPLFKNASVVAYFKDEPIPVQQATSILKQ